MMPSNIFIAQHEVLPAGEQDGAIILVTDGVVSEERRALLEFFSGQPVILRSLSDYPALQGRFSLVIAACKKTLAKLPTTVSESAEEFLERTRCRRRSE